jgi:winged helix-turn-helix
VDPLSYVVLSRGLGRCLSDALLQSLPDDEYEVLIDSASAPGHPKCEPQLGKGGLYKAIAGDNHDSSRQMATLWVLNLADGKHSLLDIAERSGMHFEVLHSVAVVLAPAGLLVEQPTDTAASRWNTRAERTWISAHVSRGGCSALRTSAATFAGLEQVVARVTLAYIRSGHDDEMVTSEGSFVLR